MKSAETKSMVLLHHHLRALRLPTIGSECVKLTTQAAADNVDHLAYLLQLCELELLERERKAADRRPKAARFPTMKSLDNFDFTARPSVNKMLIAERARC
jgi:DNA replication protein DnaC